MFEQLKKWLGITQKQNTVQSDPVAQAYHRLADLPNEKALIGRTIAVCRNGQLVLTKTAETPQRLDPGEVCWVLPAGDVPLTLHTVMGQDEIKAALRIVFDPDHQLARFLLDREKIEKPELLTLLSQQWTELADLEQTTAAMLLTDSDTVSRFRTHLSLLLQSFGLRCVGIDRIEIVQSEEIIEAELVVPEEVSAELVLAVEDVKNGPDWDRFLDKLDEAGFEPDLNAAQELETLGEEYLQRKASAREVALCVRKIIQQKNREIAAIKQGNRFWDPTVLRIRLTGNQETSVTINDESEKNIKLPKTTRRPSTWYMFRQTKIDEKLQNYLQTAFQEMLTLIDLIQNRQNQIEEKARMNETRKTVIRLQDHLQTMPTLLPKQKNLRRKQRDIKELVQSVKRSVNSAGLAIGLLKNLAADNKTNENAHADVALTVHLLENEIVNRKNIYL